jgi:hypothetical protein
MLADNPTLLDELDIDTQRMLEVAERPALVGMYPQVFQQSPSRLFCSLAAVVLIECVCRIPQSVRCRTAGRCRRSGAVPQTQTALSRRRRCLKDKLKVERKLRERSEPQQRQRRASAGLNNGSDSKAGSSGRALAVSMPGYFFL